MMIFPTLHIEFEKWKFNKEYGVWVSNFGNFKDIHKRPIPKKIYSQNGYVSVKTKHGNCGEPYPCCNQRDCRTY